MEAGVNAEIEGSGMGRFVRCFVMTVVPTFLSNPMISWGGGPPSTFNAQRDIAAISELVFHSDGAPVVDFRKRWVKACTDAKVPGRLFHDLRRTAIRDMVRAGIPETVAMSISGHKTASVFHRYNITSEEDRRDALRRVQAYRSTLPATRDNVVSMPGK